MVAGVTYSYDGNGNLLRGGGRTLSWNAENQPTHIVSGGATETYQYDADGARVTRSVTPGLSTRYAFGLYEVEGAITRKILHHGGAGACGTRQRAWASATCMATIWAA